jgi:sugar phosphate permease
VGNRLRRSRLAAQTEPRAKPAPPESGTASGAAASLTRPRYRWLVLAVGTAAQASFSVVLIGMPVLAPALRDRYDLGVAGVGGVLAAATAGMTVSLLPWGIAADRVGERVAIALGLGGAASALVGAAFAPSVEVLVPLLVLAGLAGASVNAASGRAVMHWFGPEERGLALGIRQAAIPIGGAIGALLLPVLGLQAGFLAMAGGCLVAAVAGAIALREAGGEIGELGRPLRDARTWWLSFGSSLLLVGQIAVIGFVVLFLHDERGLSPSAAAAVLAVIQLIGIAIRIGAGWWSDLLGSRIVPLRRLGVALGLTVAGAALLVDAPLAALVPVLVAAGALGLSWNGLSFTAAAEFAGRARSGAAIGLQQTALAVSYTLAAIGFATVVDATSWRIGFALAAICPLLGSGVLGRLVER